MKFYNEYDMRLALQRHQDNTVLRAAVLFLINLKDETNAHSDGWAYWPKPCRAAKQLMELIDRGGIATEQEYAKALTPIKSFYTRYGNAAGMKFPKVL